MQKFHGLYRTCVFVCVCLQKDFKEHFCAFTVEYRSLSRDRKSVRKGFTGFLCVVTVSDECGKTEQWISSQVFIRPVCLSLFPQKTAKYRLFLQSLRLVLGRTQNYFRGVYHVSIRRVKF